MKINLFLAGLVLLLTPLLEGQAATVVDWGGSSYVSTTTNLALPAANHAIPGSGIWAYSASTPISPGSGYTTPSGKSGTFYGGAYLTRSDSDGTTSSRNWSLAQVTDGGTGNDFIDFYRGNSSGAFSYSGAAFVAFLKEDFLGEGNQNRITLDMDSSISATTSSMVSGSFRLAILSEGQWYVSETSRTTLGTLSLSGSALLTSNWAEWSPNGGANGQLGLVPALFGVSGSSFTNIEGFGILTSFNALPANGSRLQITAFSASAMVIPEPSTLALVLTGSLAGIITVARRRHV